MEPEGKIPAEKASGSAGCNLVALILLLIVLATAVVAGWVSMPGATPDPVDTGIPPTAPATTGL